jgi:hypothetical protein
MSATSDEAKAERVVDARGNLLVPSHYRTTYGYPGAVQDTSSYVIGVIELAAAVMLAAGAFHPLASARGAAMSGLT